MRKILTVSFLWLVPVFMALPAFALDLDFYCSASVHYDYSLLAGKEELCTNYLLVNGITRLFSKGGTFAQFDLDWRFKGALGDETHESAKEVEYAVNEAYLGIPLLDNLMFTFGKKRLLWGVGFAYSPADFVAGPASPFVSGLKQGVYSGELSFFHYACSLDSVLVFSGRPEICGYGLRLSTYSLFRQTDLSFMGYYGEDDGLNLGMAFESTPFTAPFWRDLALYGETGLVQSSFSRSRLRGDDFYHRWLAGVRYVHPATETAAVLEYFYLEDGFSPEKRKEFLKQQPGLNLPWPSARRNLFFNLQRPALTRKRHPFTDTLSLAARVFGNLEDESMMVTTAATSALLKNTRISLEGAWYVGDDDTEYGSLPVEWVYSLVFEVDF